MSRLNTSLQAQRSSDAPAVRLAAGVAHEVRSALSSILYSADFLDVESSAIAPHVVSEALHEIGEASRRLQLMSESLLELAGLGPAVSVPVSLRSLLERAHTLLLSFHRGQPLGLRFELAEQEPWVRGNPVLLEQAVLHAVMSAAAHTSHRSLLLARCTGPTADGAIGVSIGTEELGRERELFRLELPRSEGPR